MRTGRAGNKRKAERLTHRADAATRRPMMSVRREGAALACQTKVVSASCKMTSIASVEHGQVRWQTGDCVIIIKPEDPGSGVVDSGERIPERVRELR